MSLVGRALLFAWELPQNTLGALVLAQFAARRKVASARWERERSFVEITADGAMSLGWFVFFSNEDNQVIPAGCESKDHEYGQSIQWRRLRPLRLRAGFKTSRRCTADPLRPAASSILDGHPARLRTLSLQGLRLFAQLGPVLKPALTVVGAPSVARGVYAHVFKTRTGRRWGRYYDGFPEDQADRLGGVDRSLRPAP